MIIGRYTTLAKLATGGMAELFLARFEPVPGFEKIVVLKLLRANLVAGRELVRMFHHEARVMLGLTHPNIVQVFDLGTWDERPFLVLEYVPGSDLRGLLRRSARRGAALPLGDALHIAIGACAGLHHAHEQRSADGQPHEIVHRDVTPANLLVSFDGAVKISDFGIAKSSLRAPDTTAAGEVRGTLPYLSPEQCCQQPLDRRSDVFSLCALLYEASTGARLHDATGDYEVMRQILECPAPDPRSRRADYPDSLADVVLRGLAKHPDDRWQTAQELQIALEEVAAAERIRVSPLSLAHTVRELLEDSAVDREPSQATAATRIERDRAPESAAITIFKSVAHRDYAHAAELQLRGRFLLALAEALGVWAGEGARRAALAVLPPGIEPSGPCSVRYLIALVELAATYGIRPRQLGALMHPRIRRMHPEVFARAVHSVADLAAIEGASTRIATDVESSFRFFALGPTALRVARVDNRHPCDFNIGLLEGLFQALDLETPAVHEVRCRWVDGGDCTFDVTLQRPLA